MSENFTAFKTVFIGNLENLGREKKFSEESAKLKKVFNLKWYEMVYLQNGLFEQQSCIVFLFIFLCSSRAPHFGQSPYFVRGYLGFSFQVCPFMNRHKHLLHLYFSSPVFEYFPSLTILSYPHVWYIILLFIRGDLLFVGEGFMAHSKFFINIILNIMKKLSKLFGLGGMYVEIIKDVRFGIVPLKSSEAIEMMKGIKGYNLLKGARGEKGGNIKKIDEIILRFSQMVNEIEEIEVIDLNPVFTYQKDAFVDVRIKIKEEK